MWEAHRIQSPRQVRRLIAGGMIVWCASTYCLSLDAPGRRVHAKRWRDAAKRVWRGDRGALIRGRALKLYLLEDQFNGQNPAAVRWRGCAQAPPNGNAERWPAARLPLDRLLIKVLARGDFILSWKVSKGASCDAFNSLSLQPYLKISRGNVATCQLHWSSIPSLLWPVWAISPTAEGKKKQIPGNN